MCFTVFLVETAARDEEVEGRLEVQLRVMQKTLPAIPACCPQSARRVGEAVECERDVLIGGIHKRGVRDRIRSGVVQETVCAPLGRRAANTTEAGLHVRLPLSLWPTRTRLLDAESGVDREGCRTGAIGREGVLTGIA